MDAGRRSVVNRLKTAQGHLNGVTAMVTGDAYCPDVMRQLAAVQQGRTEEIVDELREALTFDKRVFRPAPLDSTGQDRDLSEDHPDHHRPREGDVTRNESTVTRQALIQAIETQGYEVPA
ncbi:MAG: metal-sensitive transcriptional regulator [Egibacteraceae bacterium]